MNIAALRKSDKQPSLFDFNQKHATGFTPYQVKLLNQSIRQRKDLDELLLEEGFSTEDLRYEFDEPLPSSSKLYRRLEDFSVKPHQVPVLSFFSGAGGLDLGFEAAGFQHVGMFEINELFCQTVRHNRPKWHVVGPPDYSGDVSEVEEASSEIRRLIGRRKYFEGVFIGGPPCQPFSIAANQRFSKAGQNFKRVGYAHETYGNLLFNFIALIKAFRPRAFLIENVPGLSDVDGGIQLEEALQFLESSGYSVEKPFVLNAAHYGVPQHRFRMLIIGSRTKSPFHPPPIANQVIPCSSVFTMPIDNVANHVTRKHKPESLLRYMKLLYGQRDHLGRVDRLNPHLPSKTVIAGGTAGGGRSHLHPRIPRTISVREAARLQCFPDDYVFQGPVARQFTQVGNAVPPVLAVQLASALKESFFK